MWDFLHIFQESLRGYCFTWLIVWLYAIPYLSKYNNKTSWCVWGGIIPAGRPLYSSAQSPAEWGWMCKWLNDTEYLGHCAASYLHKTHIHTHTHKGKIRHPTKMHEAPQSEQTQCDLHAKGFHNYVIILRLEFMRPNEFKVHSRFRLSLGRPESCRCMGKWRWTHFPLLCHLCDSVKHFHQLYVRVFGRISRYTVTWLGGQTAAILSMLFKC